MSSKSKRDTELTYGAWKLDGRNPTHWKVSFAVIICLAFVTRFYKITEPDHVCWDETHFGKMGSWYINRTFFFDVHPPLGKMLIGLSGYLTGYNGTFPFGKPGDKYEDHNYVGMRVFCAFLGSMVVPFAFVIVWELSRSLNAAVLSSFLIIFDIGLVTLSQYILLDPILMFFIVGAFMAIVKFKAESHRPFSKPWWAWLIATGVFLSCAISVKFVGLFVVLLVGLYTAYDLWEHLGNLKEPMVQVTKHFVCRAICLIALPMCLYMLYFHIHLQVLYKSGSGDGFFSSEFQSRLQGNSLYMASMPREVAYGAQITLKNHRTGGAYLHSHWHLYPEGVGARQQQVTTYSHKDENNNWIIKRYDIEPDRKNETVELVRNGDLIRLEHVITTRNLHSHKEPAPVTKRHYQVTCYGENGTGDANDVWRVEVVGGQPGEAVQTVTSKLKLVHYLTNCALYSHNKQLPKWGYEQMEVTCTPNLRDKNTLWNVEDNHFSHLPNVSFEAYAPGFLKMFLESHAVMLQGNAGLKPKEGEVTSRPWQWPINYKGQFFSGIQYRIYLLGNPIIWWGDLACMAVYFAIQVYIFIRKKRGYVRSAQIEETTT
ncbi:protein O-mannosyl-transferase 2-like isoform X2 [Ornithodoros turicata]|uniref:protein O-mannosyl-transferase 2-like isoform X2 n=1 Tax=Ornithodoros turicata TaxID=34597 RepID=UPI003138B466